MFSLWSKLGCGKIKIVDVGAMDVGECKYQALIDQDACDIIGFEPNEKECQKLNVQKKGTYFPYVIGNGDERWFCEYNYPMNNSFFGPNTKLLKKFQQLEGLMVISGKKSVLTRRLDDFGVAKGADLLMIDIQGGELEAFGGAQELLKDVLVIQTEVMFLEMYQNQPLFADVDKFLRKSGFQIHRFASKHNTANGRCFKPVSVGKDVIRPMSQIIWGDIVYVKDFMKFESMAPEKLLKIAAIIHDLYCQCPEGERGANSYDLVAHVLLCHDSITNGNKLEVYQELMGKDKK